VVGVTGFSNPDFMRAHDLIEDIQKARRAAMTAFMSLKENAPRLSSMARAVRTLPRLTLILSGSPEGKEIAELLSRSRALIPARVAVSVLTLPHNPEDYMRGRKRQAVRTNVTQGRAIGITCRKEICPEQLRHRIHEVLDQRDNPNYEPLLERVDTRSGEFWLAIGANDKAVALAVVTVDVQVARLAWMLSAQQEKNSAARYLLSTEIFTDLARRQVRYVIADCALFLPPGIIYFQRLLGFQPMNLDVRRAGTESRRRPR
jgi:hypothetical protein